jgi:hypothetical protein
MSTYQSIEAVSEIKLCYNDNASYRIRFVVEHLSSTIKCDEICKNATNLVTPKAAAKL